MQALISSWLNLEEIIFKPENEIIYSTNDHLWRLKFAKYFVQQMQKNLPLRKVTGSTSRSKQREERREKKELDFVQ